MIRNIRVHAFLGFAVCAVSMLMAVLYFQKHLGLSPCHLCIFQRVAMMATGAVFLVAALHGPSGSVGRWFYAALATITAAIGAAIAGRHVYVQSHGSNELCGGTLSYLFDNLSTFDVIQMVMKGDQDCAKVDWTFLGQGMPFWVLVTFVGLIAWAIAMPLVTRGGSAS
jgi:disulfide bond formation protein DsbB